MIDGKGDEVGRWTSSSPISAFSLFPQEDMKSKEASLREKEVVIQKLMNNLNNREGELKVNIISQISCQFFSSSMHAGIWICFPLSSLNAVWECASVWRASLRLWIKISTVLKQQSEGAIALESFQRKRSPNGCFVLATNCGTVIENCHTFFILLDICLGPLFIRLYKRELYVCNLRFKLP